MTAPHVMIVHFPPCWNFIYSLLPHEMVMSNVVCLDCSLAQLLVPHAILHTSGLINMNPGGKRFTDQIGGAGGACQAGKRDSNGSSVGKLTRLQPAMST